MGLHAWSISYCDYVRSDGFIPTGAWPSVPGVRAAVQTLETAGLWEPVTHGYRLHDYTDWNRSRAQIEADQQGARGRQHKHRSRVTEPVTNGEQTPDITRDFGRSSRAPNPGPGELSPAAAAAVLNSGVRSTSREVAPAREARLQHVSALISAAAAAAAATPASPPDFTDLPDEVRQRLGQSPLA
jgi:hypothetical protein